MRITCVIVSAVIFLIATMYLFANKNIIENKTKLTLKNSKSILIQTIYLIIGMVGDSK